eukprot:2562712-Prymnesium_polylepis.2
MVPRIAVPPQRGRRTCRAEQGCGSGCHNEGAKQDTPSKPRQVPSKTRQPKHAKQTKPRIETRQARTLKQVWAARSPSGGGGAHVGRR